MMTPTNILVTAATWAVLGSALPAFAGTEPIIEAAEPAPCVDWCDTLKKIGTVYKDKENAYVQELKFFGRYQYQLGSISGNDVNGDNFNSNFTNHRRFRLGAQMKFANYFKLKANVNLVRDLKPRGFDTDWGLPDDGLDAFDEAKLTFDAGKAFGLAGLDSLNFTYGRQKLKIGQEGHNSSKKIKTIERTSLGNMVYRSARPVGLTVDASKGSWKGAAAIFSDKISEGIWDSVAGEWNGGLAYYVSATKTFDSNDQLIMDFIYHDDGATDLVDWVGYDWAASAAYAGSVDRWGYVANIIVGDHGDNDIIPERGGAFYGGHLTGTYELVEGTLEAVGQYQWMGSSKSEGVRTNSRLFRADNGGDVNSGRGDSHHSLYAGLNWYLCGDNAKFMTGVEYQNLNTPEGKADATTLWLAFRSYF